MAGDPQSNEGETEEKYDHNDRRIHSTFLDRHRSRKVKWPATPRNIGAQAVE